jgi:hypothetical protein
MRNQGYVNTLENLLATAIRSRRARIVLRLNRTATNPHEDRNRKGN